MTSKSNECRAIVKRHQLFSVEHKRSSKYRPGTVRPALSPPDEDDGLDPEKAEALRPPALFFSDKRRIDI